MVSISADSVHHKIHVIFLPSNILDLFAVFSEIQIRGLLNLRDVRVCSLSTTTCVVQSAFDFNRSSFTMMSTMVRLRVILQLTNRGQSSTNGVGLLPRFSSLSTDSTSTDTTTATGNTTTWSEHRLNCGRALVKAAEVSNFKDLCQQPATTLQGIGPKHGAKLQQVGLHTIQDLANYRFFHLAAAIQTLAETEQEGGRLELAVMNMDKGLDKDHEKQSFQEILKSPVHCLQGISEQKAADVWKPLGVVTVQDLATLKYFRWAQAIVTAAKFEQIDVPTPTSTTSS
jgi:hypothetical protein